MLGTSVSKFHELVPVVRTALTVRPFGTNSQWITPSKFHQKHNITLGRTDLFNDDFGRFKGTKPLFRSVRVAVIDPFFITCDSYRDKCVIHGITDKLTTDIHSMLSLLRHQFMKNRSTSSVWFKDINLAMYCILLCTKFFWEPMSTF